MKAKTARRLAESEFEDGPAPNRPALAEALLEALDREAELEGELEQLANRRLETSCALQDEVEKLGHSLADAMGQIEAIQGANATHMARVEKLEAALRQKDWDFAEEQTLRIGLEEWFEKYIPDQLSATQVAAMMGVSRSRVCELIDRGHLPGRKVGEHRRVNRRDFFTYHRNLEARQESAMAELAAFGEDESDV